jgi:hypothetical protein
MKKSSATLSFLGIAFVSCLVVSAILKIWIPDIINDDIFVKLILTFGVLTLGTLVIQLLKSLSTNAEEKTGKDK